MGSSINTTHPGNIIMSLDLETLLQQRQDDNAKQALLNARATLERTLRELDHHAAWLDNAATAQDKARVMNSVLQELTCNILPNLRLDLIADAQADFARRAE
jgi:hypothetical protein